MADDTAVRQGLSQEDAPSLADLATPEEGIRAWPRGWYRAEIISGYPTGKGSVFETNDVLAKDPESRNLFICLRVDGESFVPSDPDPTKRKLTKGPGGTRNIRYTLNYRPGDLTVERIEQVKRAREAYKSISGAWSNTDKAVTALQASSLSLGRIGQFEKAMGFKLPRAGNRFDVSKLITQAIEVRLTISETGFNDVAAVAAAGTKTK